MASKINHISNCQTLFCNWKKIGVVKPNSFSSSTAENDRDVESIAKKLVNLPKVKARPGFDQRMAAAFAMELERETQERNKSWLEKKSQISLPDITTDLIKDLF